MSLEKADPYLVVEEGERAAVREVVGELEAAVTELEALLDPRPPHGSKSIAELVAMVRADWDRTMRRASRYATALKQIEQLSNQFSVVRIAAEALLRALEEK